MAYPNPNEPILGAFIRSRLQQMTEWVDIQVVAPVSPLRYSNPKRIWAGVRGIPTARYDGNIKVLHPRYVTVPLGGPINVFLLFAELVWRLALIRQEFPFDAIDAHFGYPEGAVAALLATVFGRPFTVTLRGCEVEHGQYRFRRICMAWALKRANRVISVSERLRQFAISLGVDPSRAVTIPNGVDTRTFFARPRPECRQMHAIAESARVILSVGVLMELKGHHRIVRALKILKDRGVTADLLIAGEVARAKGYEPEIRAQISKLGLDSQVHLLGRVEREALAELMCAADVLCLASSREGWPNVVHEALSCGTPVVATDVGAIPQMIPSERYGFIVPVNDDVALADALQQALQEDWDRRAILAWGQARSWEQAAREAAEHIQQICSQTGSRT
jgi:teichuronic acid biosynthesis glycosyltransferase TuaC